MNQAFETFFFYFSTSKHVKSTFTAKKPQIMASIIVKQENSVHKINRSYIPLYMKRRNTEKNSDRNNLNKSLDSTDTEVGLKKDTKYYPPLIRSKTDEIRKELLKFHNNITKNTYLVFCNEQKATNSATAEQNTANTTSDNKNINEKEGYITRVESSQSLNSSTCSSPNSIATVRTNAVNMKSRNLSYRRHSGSSHKSSLNTSESDNNAPNKTKKVTVKCKSSKRPNNSKDTNKENIPQSTENFSNKESDKFIKSPFVRQRKSVCIALKTDRSSIQTTTRTLLKHKSSNKSNIKIPTPESTDVEKKRSLSMDVLIKSLKSETFSENGDAVSNQITSYGSSECANMVLVVKPQELLTRQQAIPTTGSVNTVDNSLLTEWMQDSHVDNEADNITNYVRHLIEELLDVIDFVGIIDSRLMSLSLDATRSRIVVNESMCSFKTVTADYLNNSYVNSLNRTFDSVLGDESTVSLTGTRMTVTDLDLLSFKSITSVSKHSEYFLADSELNSSTPLVDQTQTSGLAFNPTSVTDIFERRELRSSQVCINMVSYD